MRFTAVPVLIALACAGSVTPAPTLFAQSQTAASRVVGSVTAISGNSVTVKPDTGSPVTFTVSGSARILETQPGAKSLAGASPVALNSIAVGDRVLAALQPSSDGSTPVATTLIAMKQAALAEHRRAEQEAWQRNGVGGLVKSVSSDSGTITIASGDRTITIHTTPQTIVRRYSADSIKFADATPSSLTEIRPGDQLRAKGAKSADGTSITADAIVAGTFRNIAGIVDAVDATAGTLVVRDLATKKKVTIRVNAASQLHDLPEPMATALAERFKKGGSGNHPSTNSAEHASWKQSHSGGSQQGTDISQMLQHAPTMNLSQLKKGEAVMIVATEGTSEQATAVTLLAGVGPILRESPSASRSMFSASWNVNNSGGQQGGAGESSTQ